MAARVRKDDVVVVISGDHRGQRGKVLRLIPDKDMVVVEGVNMVTRHVRRSRKYPQGGRIQREAAMPLCKVQPVDPKTGRGTRVRFRMDRDGAGKIVTKQRMSIGGTVLGEVKRAARQGAGA